MKVLKRIRNYQYMLMGFIIFYLVASLFDTSDDNNVFSVAYVVLLLMLLGCNIFYSVAKEFADKINKLEITLNKSNSRD